MDTPGRLYTLLFGLAFVALSVATLWGFMQEKDAARFLLLFIGVVAMPVGLICVVTASKMGNQD